MRELAGGEDKVKTRAATDSWTRGGYTNSSARQHQIGVTWNDKLFPQRPRRFFRGTNERRSRHHARDHIFETRARDHILKMMRPRASVFRSAYLQPMSRDRMDCAKRIAADYIARDSVPGAIGSARKRIELGNNVAGTPRTLKLGEFASARLAGGHPLIRSTRRPISSRRTSRRIALRLGWLTRSKM